MELSLGFPEAYKQNNCFEFITMYLSFYLMLGEQTFIIFQISSKNAVTFQPLKFHPNTLLDGHFRPFQLAGNQVFQHIGCKSVKEI